MRSDDNLPPGCTARDVETNGSLRVRYGRQPLGEPLTVEKARQLWAQYGKMFERERQAGIDRQMGL